MNVVLEHYRGHEQFVARMLDLIDRAQRQYRCVVTPFLTPQEQMIAQKVIGKQLFTCLDGGYEDAEMKRIYMAPYEITEEHEIVCLCASYRKQERKISHRDVLGALLHLGIERDQFGDILVQEEVIYIMVASQLQDFIMAELRQIARYAVSFAPYEGAISYEAKLSWHHATLASSRLDCVVSACIKGSRSKAETLIKGKCVKVDHLPLEDCKVLCNNNCTVSIRGYGRFQIKITTRTSRKGRLVVEIGTYQ